MFCNCRPPLGLFLLLSFPQPHPRSSAVLIDELDAGGFERSAKRLVIGRCQRSFILSQFGAANCGYAYSRIARKILGAPADKRSGGPKLCAGEGLHHLDKFIPNDIIHSIWNETLAPIGKRYFEPRSEDMKQAVWTKAQSDRRYFIGGSDARIIMGDNEAALLRLWREKRGEVEP